MPRPVPLNNIDHHGLRVLPRQSARLTEQPMSAITFPAEFRSVQAHYPIVFQKTADGSSFQPLALFGFEPGENLFAKDGLWDASYLPMAIEREPFFIGREGDKLSVHVDTQSPLLAHDAGEALFRPHGGTTEFLDRMTTLLGNLHDGMQTTPAFVAALLQHELLESFVFDVELPDGGQHRLAGFYTVHEERLAALPGTALEALQRAGHLLPIYMAMASLSRLRDLVDRRIRRT